MVNFQMTLVIKLIGAKLGSEADYFNENEHCQNTNNDNVVIAEGNQKNSRPDNTWGSSMSRKSLCE